MNINKAIREATGINRDDFDSDLNAMHEAEKVLKDDFTSQIFQKGAYIRNLENIVRCMEDGWSWALLHATATQRAEAFLRTLGKWEALASSDVRTKEDES